MIRRFARPYARAIMDAAGSPQNASALRGELMIFANALRSSRELHDLYANPVDEATKLTITRPLASKMNASELATRTLEVLVQHHRINDIDAIVQALGAYVNAALGIAIAEVRTAKPLGHDEIQQLAETLSAKVGKKVELDIKTDPELLGGFVVRIGSEIWDASVVGKINKFRASLA
ncbi:MAG TPA: ATP synthase F1 subunit delta [Thermoanaerobaculia bacterium]